MPQNCINWSEPSQEDWVIKCNKEECMKFLNWQSTFSLYTLRKVSKCGVFSGPYLDTFHAVYKQNIQGRKFRGNVTLKWDVVWWFVLLACFMICMDKILNSNYLAAENYFRFPNNNISLKPCIKVSDAFFSNKSSSETTSSYVY